MWTEYCNCGHWFVFPKISHADKTKESIFVILSNLINMHNCSYKYLMGIMRFSHRRIKANSLHSHKQQDHYMMKKNNMNHFL